MIVCIFTLTFSDALFRYFQDVPIWTFGNYLHYCRKSIDFWGDMIYLILGLLAILKIFAESTEVMELKMTAEKFIENHPSFTTGEFADALQKGVPGIGRSTIYSILKKKCDSGEISRVSKGRFVHSARKDYSYELSETARDIVALIQENYPLVEFQIWELYQMNEFVNHLLAKNTIFIEVENMLDESIFNLLFDRYPHVLHNPSLDEYYKYAGDETIIVRKLISEAPPPYGQYRQASLEKLLVDLFGRGISGSILSRSEYRAIYEDAFQKYNINQSKMFRYARRRGIEKVIRDFIHEETRIVLEDDK